MGINVWHNSNAAVKSETQIISVYASVAYLAKCKKRKAGIVEQQCFGPLHSTFKLINENVATL